MMSTATPQGPYVFLSYPRSEEVVAKRLEQDLRVSGLQVWRDESSIDPGSPDWEEAIREAISHAYAVVLIASPNVIQSRYIKGELSLAERYHPNRIYPIWMDGTEWSDCVPIDFINTQYVDMRGEKYAVGLRALVTVLQKAKEQPSPLQQDSEVYQQGALPPYPPIAQQGVPSSPSPQLSPTIPAGPAGTTTRRSVFPQTLASPRNILLLALVILVILAGVIATIGVHQISSQASADATAITKMTATAVAKVTTNNATATAHANATATAVASHYPFSNSLVLNDPLSTGNDNNLWDDYTQTNGVCKFSAGAYHVYETEKGSYFWFCVAKVSILSNLSNFTFEAQMTILKGDCGGMVFRVDSMNEKYYLFDVCQDGTYNLYTYRNASQSTTLRSNSSSSIKQGLDQSNLLAVVARGQSITLYVNNQPIDQVSDKTYSSGQIGFVADNESGNPTEVAYNNARVWLL